EVHVYSSGRLQEFGALEPPLPANVTWHVPESEPATIARPSLRVLVLSKTGREPRAVAVEQALQAIARHRLPDLDWRMEIASETNPGPGFAAVIWCAESPAPAAWQDNSGDTRWIDLNESQWRFGWQAPGFPERLLDAMLDPEQDHLNWSGAPVSIWPEPPMEDEPVAVEQLPRRSLQSGLALALILLWGLERWLSERRTDAQV
ncbi:MAG: hypothetical protein ACK2U9_20850, partial [Anaerolineae bacterium]